MTMEQLIRKESTLLQDVGPRTECLKPRGPVQCSLDCSSVPTPKPEHLSPVLAPRTTVVTGTLPWVLDRQLSKDRNPWITEKFDSRG